MPRANIRYEDVNAMKKANELEDYVGREWRRDLWWVVRWVLGVSLVLTGFVWWFS